MISNPPSLIDPTGMFTSGEPPPLPPSTGTFIGSDGCIYSYTGCSDGFTQTSQVLCPSWGSGVGRWGGSLGGSLFGSTPQPGPPQTPCSDLSLNNLGTFWNQNFATPQQVNSFFQGQPNAPGSWNGAYAAQQFINEGINPGLAVGIVGAETSFGNGPSLSATNIGNPFSCAIGRISNFNGSANCAAQTAFNDAFAGEGGTFLTPLSALVAGHYTTTDVREWPQNVEFWFRRFAKSLGRCM